RSPRAGRRSRPRAGGRARLEKLAAVGAAGRWRSPGRPAGHQPAAAAASGRLSPRFAAAAPCTENAFPGAPPGAALPFPQPRDVSMTILRMTDLDLTGKRVLIRQDLNVPIDNGRITSERPTPAPFPRPSRPRE